MNLKLHRHVYRNVGCRAIQVWYACCWTLNVGKPWFVKNIWSCCVHEYVWYVCLQNRKDYCNVIFEPCHANGTRWPIISQHARIRFETVQTNKIETNKSFSYINQCATKPQDSSWLHVTVARVSYPSKCPSPHRISAICWLSTATIWKQQSYTTMYLWCQQRRRLNCWLFSQHPMAQQQQPRWCRGHGSTVH